MNNLLPNTGENRLRGMRETIEEPRKLEEARKPWTFPGFRRLAIAIDIDEVVIQPEAVAGDCRQPHRQAAAEKDDTWNDRMNSHGRRFGLRGESSRARLSSSSQSWSVLSVLREGRQPGWRLGGAAPWPRRAATSIAFTESGQGSFPSLLGGCQRRRQRANRAA